MGNKKNVKKYASSGKKPCEMCSEVGVPLQEHHIRGRKIKNYNDPSNVCYICPNCHSRIHYDIVIVEGWFVSTGGRQLVWHEKDEESMSGDDAEVHIFK